MPEGSAAGAQDANGSEDGDALLLRVRPDPGGQMRLVIPGKWRGRRRPKGVQVGSVGRHARQVASRSMSLTSHLRARDSPVREWFAENLDGTRRAVGAGNDVLCGQPRLPCVLPPPPDCDIGLSGTAIDYLIRATLADDALGCTVATGGAQRVDARGAGTGVRLEREAVATINRLAPWKDGRDLEELREICRMCIVLARFDQFFRAGLQVWAYVGEPLSDQPSLAAYAERVVPPACLLDLETMARAVIEDHIDLRKAKPLLLNPKFDLSVALGGADGDLIAGDTLWDFKSSAHSTSVFGRDDLWQLVGYALADQSDTYKVTSLGIAAIRRRRRVCWSLPELLAELSNERRALKQWRAGFAEAVSAANTAAVSIARSRISKEPLHPS
jgi:hypothetical protein